MSTRGRQPKKFTPLPGFHARMARVWEANGNHEMARICREAERAVRERTRREEAKS